MKPTSSNLVVIIHHHFTRFLLKHDDESHDESHESGFPRQYFAPMNFITTCDALVAPLPDAPWATELSQRFRFEPVGCLVSPQAPHVAQARRNGAVPVSALKDGMPREELKQQ